MTAPAPLTSDAIAAIIGEAAGRNEPVVTELLRLAKVGVRCEERLPSPRPRTDGSLDRAVRS